MIVAHGHHPLRMPVATLITLVGHSKSVLQHPQDAHIGRSGRVLLSQAGQQPRGGTSRPSKESGRENVTAWMRSARPQHAGSIRADRWRIESTEADSPDQISVTTTTAGRSEYLVSRLAPVAGLLSGLALRDNVSRRPPGPAGQCSGVSSGRSPYGHLGVIFEVTSVSSSTEKARIDDCPTSASSESSRHSRPSSRSCWPRKTSSILPPRWSREALPAC